MIKTVTTAPRTVTVKPLGNRTFLTRPDYVCGLGSGDYTVIASELQLFFPLSISRPSTVSSPLQLPSDVADTQRSTVPRLCSDWSRKPSDYDYPPQCNLGLT